MIKRNERKWTQRDIDFLILNYKKMSIYELGAELDRTSNGVRFKIKRILSELESISGPEHKTCLCCKKTYDLKFFWTSHEWTKKTRIVGTCRTCRNSNRQKQRASASILGEKIIKVKRWTDQELNYIRDNCGHQTDIEIATILNRSHEQVGLKRRAMGLDPFVPECKNESVKEIYDEQRQKKREKEQKDLEDEIELIRSETIYLINNMTTLSNETVTECERKMDELVIKNPLNWWARRINWKLGQFIELILPGYEFVPVIW